MLESAVEQLEREGELEISVGSVGHRSSFIGAVLATLPGATISSNPRRVHLNAATPPSSRPVGIGAWIFQANPKLWDLEAALREISTMRWLVRQHRDKVRP